MTKDERSSNDEARIRFLNIRVSSFIRRSSFVIRILALLVAGFLFAPRGFGQAHNERPTPLDPAQAEREARALIIEMLSQRPAEDATNTGLLKIRREDDQEREIPVRLS